MRIGKTLVLTPVKKDGVMYIEYIVQGNMAIVRRWNSFSARECAGRDALGKYYDSQKHALTVIRAFKAKERARAQKAQDAHLLPGEKLDLKGSPRAATAQ